MNIVNLPNLDILSINQKTMRPIVNREACIGCMRCEEIEPLIFKVIDGISEVQDQDAEGNMIIFEDHADAIERSIKKCPVSAISLEQAGESEPVDGDGLTEDPTVD